MDVAVGEIADDLGAAAFERDVQEVQPCTFGEDFGVDLLVGADAGTAVEELARMRLGMGEELREGFERSIVRGNGRRGREEEHRDIREREDDLHVACIIDLELFREQDRRQPIGGNVADHQRVAVGAGASHLLDCDDAGGAGLVLDEYALPKAPPQVLGIEARNHVGQAAGRVGNDDPDRLRRIWRLCRRRDGGKKQCKARSETTREQKPPS